MENTAQKKLGSWLEQADFDISINHIGLPLSEDLRMAATRKIGRVRRYAPDALRAMVDIEKVAEKRSREQFRVLVRYEIPGYDMIAEHHSHEPMTAIDLVAEKIERRLRKRKTAFLAARFGRHGRRVRIADFCSPSPKGTSLPLAGVSL